MDEFIYWIRVFNSDDHIWTSEYHDEMYGNSYTISRDGNDFYVYDELGNLATSYINCPVEMKYTNYPK